MGAHDQQQAESEVVPAVGGSNVRIAAAHDLEGENVLPPFVDHDIKQLDHDYHEDPNHQVSDLIIFVSFFLHHALVLFFS